MERTAWAMTVCEKVEERIRKGPWTLGEDIKLATYVRLHGAGCWSFVAKEAGLKRSGKSCRMRWLNYLCPDLKRGSISPEEKEMIMDLHSKWGNKWSRIARSLPGRTDNELKNYWKTHVKKKCPGLMPSLSVSPTSNCPQQIKSLQGKTASSSTTLSFGTEPISSMENHQKNRMEGTLAHSNRLNDDNYDLHNCSQAWLILQQHEEDSELFSLNMHYLSGMVADANSGTMVEDRPFSSMTDSAVNCFSENDFFWDYNSLLLWNLDDDVHNVSWQC